MYVHLGINRKSMYAEFGSKQELFEAVLERLTDAFENALDNAQCAGEIDLGVDTIAQARFLTSAVLGIAVLVRAKAPPAIVEGAAEVALAHVASLVPA